MTASTGWRNRIVGHGDETPGELLANPRNWRIHPKHQQDALAGVLNEIGWVQEITVNRRTGFVVDGHLRVALAVSRRERFVPVRYVDLDEDEEALILATLDPISALATQDADQLTALLAGLETADEAVRNLLRDLAPPRTKVLNPDDADLTPPDEPITQAGDLWLLGDDHRLLCGDSTRAEDVGRLLKGEQINVVITSPPYASQRTYDPDSGFQPIDPDDYVRWYSDVAALIWANLADDGSYLCNIKEHCDDGQRHLYVKDLTIAHVRSWGWYFIDEFCWRKADDGMPGGWPNRLKNAWEPVFHFGKTHRVKFRVDDVLHPTDAAFEYSPDSTKSKNGSGLLREPAGGRHAGEARPSNVVEVGTGNQTEHSASYPTGLPEFFIKLFSDDGDLVFDPFMGSGTTLIAAEETDRRAAGVEISPAYCDVIVRRWERVSGRQAVKTHP